MSRAGPIPEQIVAEAAADFVRRAAGSWSREDQQRLEQRLLEDPTYAAAYERLIESWDALDRVAAAPALLAFREGALARARRGRAQWSWKAKWAAMIAAFAVSGLLALLLYQWSVFDHSAEMYETSIGEQRMFELADRSRVFLDAGTRLSVRISADRRRIQLTEGQAQFVVAKDKRPFQVEAGNSSIVALGTQFTVEYFDGHLNVAMLEGKVAVSSTAAENGSQTVELVQGQGLRIGPEGHASFMPAEEVASASAWRQGKIIFQSETLDRAVRRMNRYSKLQLRIEDPQLADLRISGVFNIGDSAEFAAAVSAYLPVSVDSSTADLIHIRPRPRSD